MRPPVDIGHGTNRKAVSKMVYDLVLGGKQTAVLSFGLRSIVEESPLEHAGDACRNGELLSPLAGRSMPDTGIEGHMEGRRHD